MCKFFEFGILNRCNNFVCSVVVLSIPALLSHQKSLEKSLLFVAIYRLEAVAFNLVNFTLIHVSSVTYFSTFWCLFHSFRHFWPSRAPSLALNLSLNFSNFSRASRSWSRTSRSWSRTVTCVTFKAAETAETPFVYTGRKEC